MRARPISTAAMAATLFLIAGLGAAMAVNHFLAEPYNPGFATMPRIVQAHAVLGAVYLVFGALQFSPAIRARALAFHRWSGRMLVAFGLITGLSAIVIGAVIPFSGPAETVIISIFGAAYVFALTAGFLAARAGRIARHRAWMIRAYAIGAAVVTMRLIFIPALILTGANSQADAAQLSIIAFTLAFVLHTVLAELWLKLARDAA